MTASSTGAERPLPKPPSRQERIPLAILYMVSAGAIFAFSSAASKWLVATYPAGEVLFSRVFVSLVLFSAFALPTTGLSVLYTQRHGAHPVEPSAHDLALEGDDGDPQAFALQCRGVRGHVRQTGEPTVSEDRNGV